MTPPAQLPFLGELDFQPLSPYPSHVLCASAFDNPRSPDGFKLRVESLARSYLHGDRLPIRSASLRGPFTSKWLNPWARSITQQEKERRRRRGDFAKARFEKQEKRGKDKLDRERRARLLQADGRGRTLNKPIDLTEDPEAIETARPCSVVSLTSATRRSLPRLAIEIEAGFESNYDGGLELLQVHQDEAQTGRFSRTPSLRPDRILAHELRERSRDPDVPGDVEEHGVDFIASNRGETMFYTCNTKHPNLHATSTLASATLPTVPNPKHSAFVPVILSEKRSPSIDNNTRFEYSSNPQSMPTPSDSGNEGHAALIVDRQDHGAEAPNLLPVLHARSPLLFSGFTPVNQVEVQANLKRKRELDTALDRACDPRGSIPQSPLKRDIDLPSSKPAKVNQLLQSTSLTDERTCLECNTVLPRRGRSELCRVCKQRQTRNSKKSKVADSRQSEEPLPSTVDSIATILPPRNLRPSKRSMRLSMSQPGPVTRPLSPPLNRHTACSSSFPTAKPRQLMLNHQRVIRRMFPPSDDDNVLGMDDGLAELLGRNDAHTSQKGDVADTIQMPANERATWKGKQIADTVQATKVPERVEIPKTKPKPKPKRMMTFDTPVIRRETRSKRKFDILPEETGMPPHTAPHVPDSPEETGMPPHTAPHVPDSPEEAGMPPHTAPHVPDAIVPEMEEGRVDLAAIRTDHHGPPLSIIGPIEIVEPALAETPVPTVGVDVLPLGPITPRSKSRRMLEEHTNKVYSANDGTRIWQLVRRSAGIFNDVLEDHTEQAQIDPSDQLKSPEYVSTQAAMMEAQFAFQENLSSPIKDDGRTWQDETEVDSTPQPLQCNITPFHAMQSMKRVASSGGGGDGSSQSGAEINTQALFDNFLVSQDSGMTPYGQQKRASFGLTPLGPADSSSQASNRTKTGKSCLKNTAPRNLFGRGAKKSSFSTTPLSNLGLDVLNAQMESDPDEINPFITGAAAFLGS